MKRIDYLLMLLFLLQCLLSACTSPNAAQTVAASLPQLSKSPTLQITMTLNPSATQQPESTITPIPTYSLDQAYQQIKNWVEDNGDCELPCVWGLSPGQTNRQNIQHLLSFFDDMYISDTVGIWISDYGDLGGFSLMLDEGDVQTNVDMSYYFKEEAVVKILTFQAKSFEVVETEGDLELRYIFGNNELFEFVDEYTLAGVLTNYGSPTSILIAPYYNERPGLDPGWIWYSVVLNYEDVGFLAEYIMPRRTIGNSFAACVNQNTEMEIIAWDPGKSIGINDILAITSGIKINKNFISYFKPLEEATTLTIETFTETFKDPDTDACIYTPMELWPGP